MYTYTIYKSFSSQCSNQICVPVGWSNETVDKTIIMIPKTVKKNYSISKHDRVQSSVCHFNIFFIIIIQYPRKYECRVMVTICS